MTDAIRCPQRRRLYRCAGAEDAASSVASWRAFRAATSRWIATAAGTREKGIRCHGQGQARAALTGCNRAHQRSYNTARPTNLLCLVVTDDHGQPQRLIRDDDVCIMFNYAPIVPADHAGAGAQQRAQQRIRANCLRGELDATIPRAEIPSNCTNCALTRYDKNFTLRGIPPESMENLLAT